MSDELTNAAPPRLNTGAKSSGWRIPLTTPNRLDETTPFDDTIVETEDRCTTAVAERERLEEALFAARDRLADARDGEGAGLESGVAVARGEWERACEEEGKARVRLTSLSLVRSDWRREREIQGPDR